MNWKTRFAFAASGLGLALLILISQIDAGGRFLRRSEIPKTIEKLKSGTPQEKSAAAAALGRRGALRSTDVKDAIEPLRNAALKEKDASVRAAAAKALGQIGVQPKQTVMMLLTILKKDDSDEVKAAAMEGIARLPTEAGPAVPLIRKLAKDKANKRLSRTARNVMKSLKKN